jgi:hypothetical protein
MKDMITTSEPEQAVRAVLNYFEFFWVGAWFERGEGIKLVKFSNRRAAVFCKMNVVYICMVYGYFNMSSLTGFERWTGAERLSEPRLQSL